MFIHPRPPSAHPGARSRNSAGIRRFGTAILCAAALALTFLASPLAAVPEGWDEPILLSTDAGHWIYPDIATNGDSVHAVWRDGAGGTLQYRRSLDGGVTWQPIQTLATGVVLNPRVAVADEHYVHVVWRSSSSTIKHRRSINLGATFRSATDLSTPATEGFEPDLATAGSNVHVCWITVGSNPDVCYVRSTDNGANWDPHFLVTTDGGSTEERNACISAAGSNVHVAWDYDASTTQRIRLRRNTGFTWPPPATVAIESLNTFDYISIAAVGTTVYVNREDISGGPLQYRSTNSGGSFGSAIVLGNGTTRHHAVAASEAFPTSGCTAYIRDTGLYVTSTSPSSEKLLGTVTGPDRRSTMAISTGGDRHVAVNTLSGGDDKVYYYRSKAVTIKLTPHSTTVAPGERLFYDIEVRNNTETLQTKSSWIDIFKPNGDPYAGNPIAGPRTARLDEGRVVLRTVSLRIPPNVPSPAGPFTIRGTIGTPDGHTSSFQFSISGG